MIAHSVFSGTSVDGYVSSLIDRGLLDDQRALVKLDAMFRASVIDFLHKACGNYWLADELTNETFLRAYRSLSSFRGRTQQQFRSFLFSIAMNLFRDHCRYRNHRPPASSGLLLDGAKAPCVESVGGKALEAKERAAMLRKALACLAPDRAKLVRLSHIKGLKAEQIAQILGKPSAQAVRSALCRAMKDLRTVLHRQGYFD